MPEFITKLDCELLSSTGASDKGIWKLLSPLIYKSDITNSIIIVPKGFITDFASIPRIPFIFALLGDTATKASVIHDWLYDIESGSDAPNRKTADSILKESAALSGMPFYDYTLIYIGVRLFGGNYYKQSDYKKRYADNIEDYSRIDSQQNNNAYNN